MILRNSETRELNHLENLGELTPYKTNDGTFSLRCSNYRELFHCKSGAQKEATEKFINPAELYRFKKGETLFALDVCFGLGYNSASLINYLSKSEINLNWWGLEIDYRPLEIALKNPKFKRNWSNNILKIFSSLNTYGYWESSNSKGKIFWGDARKKIHEIPREIDFDLIMLDAFSPQRCPQLWSEEFLKLLSSKLSSKGRLITYSSAASIRKSLKESGLSIMSLFPSHQSKREWSAGTVGMCSKNNDGIIQITTATHYRPLNAMEEEHLKTKASIPYRDPKGDATRNEILKKREIEQNESSLESSSSWKRRWKNAQSSLYN